MKIGVPRERKTLEKRVAITPLGAHHLIQHGHLVTIESGAGVGSFFSDDDYKKVGCKIAPTLADVWNGAQLLVKVKEPDESEFQFFREDLVIFDFLHLASLPEVAQALLKSKVTAFAYETLRTADGRLPLLEPMSEVAGKLSVLNGSYYLLSQNGGRGVLLGGAADAPPANVTVLGAGIAGFAACATAAGMGAKVTVLDINQSKLDLIKRSFGERVTVELSNADSVLRRVSESDLLIGAVLVPGAATPRILTRREISAMPKGSVFVDISIDQGGCAETSRPTTLDAPVYEIDGVIHYGVCNMPAQTPRTSTIALAAATLPYILKLANDGAVSAANHPELKSALTCLNGELTNELTAKALGI